MNFFRNIIAAVISLSVLVPAMAQDNCAIDISVAGISEGKVVPQAISTKLEAKLKQVIGKAGLTSTPYESRFFVAGRFDDAFNDVTGGTSPKVMVKTTLTLLIGDADAQKIFATESFELSGVGGSDEQAYTRALGKLSVSNKALIDFLIAGKQKIIDYYDANYQSFLNKAKQAMAHRDYGEALYYCTAIPTCCRGYNQANALAMQIYKSECDYNGQTLLAQARAAWAANPTAEGAAEASGYLSQIDPAASCAKEALALGNKMSQTTQKQWEFENITKYQNEVELEKHRINAAKEAAVAWAKSRPKTVNRYVFLTPRYY